MRCNNSDEGCDWQGSVGTLDKHIETCEFECVPCKYQYVGCDVKMMRKDIAQHEEEDDKKHLHLALQSVAIPTLSDGESLVFKMTEYSSKKKNKVVFFSDPFYTHSNGYKMRFEIYASGTGSGEGTHLSMFSRILKGPFDQSLQWPYLGTMRICVLNQLGDYNHWSMNLKCEGAQCGGTWGNEKFISHSALSAELPNKVLLVKNDSLHIKVAVQVSDHVSWLECGKKMHSLLERVSKLVINKEPLVFDMHGFTFLKNNEYCTSSPAFFTSHKGYRLCIEVHPNGVDDGEGTHVSVIISVRDGPYDRSLSWPFIGNLKIELLNQLADEGHYYQNVSITMEYNMLVGSRAGVHTYIKLTELEGGDKRFLQNDTLYFRVTVINIDNFKPWLICTRSA